MSDYLRLSVSEWNTLRRGRFQEAERLLDQLLADHTDTLRSDLGEAMTDLHLATTVIADAQARTSRQAAGGSSRDPAQPWSRASAPGPHRPDVDRASASPPSHPRRLCACCRGGAVSGGRPRLSIGELCAGYGGLGMGVAQVLDAEVAWYSEIDKGALKILEHRFAGVPNIGDMTVVDWATVPEVDVLCAGYPCQPFSHAGKRKGADDSRHLWPHVREAIRHLRPRLTVLENVSGHRSLGFDRVLGDLAEDGLHVVWTSVRASNVGAPHRRERLFIGVADADGERLAWSEQDTGGRPTSTEGPCGCRGLLPSPRTSDTNGAGAHGDGGLDLRTALTTLPTPTSRDWKGQNQRQDSTCLPGALMPTPRATDGTKGGPNQRGSSGDLMLPSAVTLLPTPAVNDMGAAYTPDTWDAWTDSMKAEHDNGNGHGKSLSIEAQRMLPTPGAGDEGSGRLNKRGNPTLKGAIEGTRPGDEERLGITREPMQQWGEYADAITRWESLTRPAPEPTVLSKRDTPQLAPAFSEWMMGLPAGWVTDTPGITRNEALRALGNGVVPQQAAAAVGFLLDVLDTRMTTASHHGSGTSERSRK